MASIYKPTYSKPIPRGAVIFTAEDKSDGRQKTYARFKRNGKTVTVPLTRDGTKILLERSKWYVQYVDPQGKEHRVPGYTDKGATEQLAARLEKQAAREEEGLVNPNEESNRKPLLDHLEDYRQALQNSSDAPTSAHVKLVIGRLTALFNGCGFVRLADLQTDVAGRTVERWLADLRRAAVDRQPLDSQQKEYTLAEATAVLGMKAGAFRAAVYLHKLAATGSGRKRRFPPATIEALQERRPKGVSVQTTNYYLVHLKAFCRWMEDKLPRCKGLLDLNPGNVQVDRRHDRRELTADELRNVLDAARNSTVTFRGLNGAARYHLYATACATGFRASALASLTPESFDLDGEQPVVTCAARDAKNRKTKVQPLPPDVAELLREYLKGRPDGERIWDGTWASDHRGAEMLRIDLAAAGVPYITEGPDGPLHADFHALRHTYLTLGGRAGIDLRTLQELAGHSRPELTARYSHRRLYDLAGAVDLLPNFLPIGGAEVTTAASTGTDDEKARVCQRVCAIVPPRHLETLRVVNKEGVGEG